MLRERLVDLSTPARVRKWKMANYSLKDYAELFFVNYDDPDIPFRAYKGQDRIFNFMQNGTTIGAILKSSRGTGKSYGCSAADAALALTRPCSSVMAGQNEVRAKDLMRKTKFFIKNSVMGPYIDKTLNNVMEFALKVPKSYVKVVPAAQGARGGHFNYGLLDEIAQFDPLIWLEVIYPMFRRKGIHWIGISTPNKEQGIFWKLWKQSTLPGNPDLGTIFIPFTRIEITIDDQDWIMERVELWNKQTGQHLTLKMYLEMQRRIMGDSAFRQEILGQFLKLGVGVFPEIYIDRAMRIGTKDQYLSSWDRVSKSLFTGIGMDLGKYHSRATYAVGHLDKKKVAWVDFIRVFDNGIGHLETIDNHAKNPLATRCLMDAIKHFSSNISVIDSTGLGDPVFEYIEQAWKKRRLFHNKFYNNKPNRNGYVFDGKSKPALIDNFLNMLEKDLIRFPYHNNAIGQNDPGWVAAELKKEMLAFSYEKTETNIKYKGEGERDDLVIAVSLLLWGLRKKPFIYIRPALR